MRTSSHVPEQLAESAAWREIGGHRAGYRVLGVLLIVLGVAAIAFPGLATAAATLAIGWALLLAGVARIVHALQLRHHRAFYWNLIGAMLITLLGGLILFYPLPGILTLTAFIAAFFVVAGVLRTLQALQQRPARGWLWLLSGGLASLALGALLLSQGPTMGVWLIGLLVGIDLIVSGWWTLALASADSATA